MLMLNNCNNGNFVYNKNHVISAVKLFKGIRPKSLRPLLLFSDCRVQRTQEFRFGLMICSYFACFAHDGEVKNVKNLNLSLEQLRISGLLSKRV